MRNCPTYWSSSATCSASPACSLALVSVEDCSYLHSMRSDIYYCLCFYGTHTTSILNLPFFLLPSLPPYFPPSPPRSFYHPPSFPTSVLFISSYLSLLLLVLFTFLYFSTVLFMLHLCPNIYSSHLHRSFLDPIPYTFLLSSATIRSTIRHVNSSQFFLILFLTVLCYHVHSIRVQ